ncbi:MAG: hypothetical protein ACRETH_04800 [Steroidobacteraceae bacterium]
MLGRLARALELDKPQLRATLAASQLIGLAMLRYGVNDLRLFFENDVRFLRQFRAFSS